MIIDPVKRPGKKPFALLTPGWRSLTAETLDGTEDAHGPRQCYDLLDKLADHVLYVRSRLTTMIHTTGADTWTADVWRGRATRVHLDGSKASVISLRGTLDAEADAFGCLMEALGFLALHRVGPGSFGTMGWNLWRATLTRSVRIAAHPEVVAPAVFGGRQEIRAQRTYTAMKSVDLMAAYPFEMSVRPFALSLREVDAGTALDPNEPGLARATVTVPSDLPYAPLPVRVADDMIQWQWGHFEGTWPWAELDAAKALGCDVKVHKCWAPGRTMDLFGDWWAIVAEARRTLSPGAARLIKSIANSLWGTFAMKGDDTAVIRWTDHVGDRTVTVKKTPQCLPHRHTAHIAAESSSRVRVRLLTEGLYGTGFSPVHVDTDGIIIRSSAPVPEPAGEWPGQWRVKETMRKIDIRAPQVYRYRCSHGCGVQHNPWHYVTAGVPSTMAPTMFERLARVTMSLGTGERDIVLAPGFSNYPVPTADRVALARITQSSLYGARLGSEEA